MRSQEHSFIRRAFLILIGQVVLSILLISRLIYLQIFSFHKYLNIAYKNKTFIFPVLAPRGKIYDRNGIVLANTQKSFRLLLNKAQYLKNNKILEYIASLLNDQALVEKSLAQLKRVKSKDYAVLIDKMTWQQITTIEQNISVLNGAMVDVYYARQYPLDIGPAVCHIVGYIRKVDTQSSGTEVKELNNIPLNNAEIGYYGVEKQYEQTLSGKVGYVEIEVDSAGRHIKEQSSHSSHQGADLNLYIDSNLQKIILNYLPENACCIISDVDNGQIMGMVSKPTFDPNIMIQALSNSKWTELRQNSNLFNKAIQGQYNPGSVFKLITILAALENGVNPSLQVQCTSKPFLDKHFHCWNRYGHGTVRCMEDAIAMSCNHYIFRIAKMLSIEKILAVARKFNLGFSTGIDLPYEKPGSLKYRNTHLATLLMMSIGQGFVITTPIQIHRMMSIIAAGYDAKLKCADISNIYEENSIPQIAPHHLDIIRNGIFKAVNHPMGNSYKNRPLNHKIKLLGKTSTIQTVSRSNYSKGIKNHGMFSGYVQYQDKKYSITIMLEHGESGQSAVKVASNILNSYFV